MDESTGRKRRSRFSDAPGNEERPTKISTGDKERAVDGSSKPKALDPAALAKLAAAKIAQAIPNGARGAAAHALAAAAPAAALASSHGHLPATTMQIDTEEQKRLAEEQRKRADMIYKSVQQQMSHIKGLLHKPTGAAGGATGTFMPAPLLLDELGRQIDAQGNVVPTVSGGPPPTTTHRPTKSSSAPKANLNPYLSHRVVDRDDKLDAVDPRLKLKKRETRAAKSFSFVEQGTYVKQADMLRARDAKKMLAGFTSGRNPRGYQKEAIVPLEDEDAEPTAATTTTEAMELHDVDVPVKPETNPPDVEWWDIEYLPKHKRNAVDKFGFIKPLARKENPQIAIAYDEMKAKYCGTIHVIEHPARVSPMFKEPTEPVALPLMLTAVERKKIRRQNRAEREKEKQDKVALGLVPPPEPKVKLSNMMKVLGEQAVADPSAIERKVRAQIAQREKNHEMRNLARKLTPEEKREKKLRKIKEDADGEIHVAVFHVPHTLANPQHRFKVDVNAQQYHLTGGVLLCQEGEVSVVVAEGGRKAIKHYTQLLMKRIRWSERVSGGGGSGSGDDDDDDDEGEGHNSRPTGGDEEQRQHGTVSATGCRLVWQGVVARRAFNNFRFQECKTKATARKVMEAKNVVQYWDLVEKSTVQ